MCHTKYSKYGTDEAFGKATSHPHIDDSLHKLRQILSAETGTKSNDG